MRTTLTLEDDVAIELQKIQQQSRRSWKQVVNEVLRVGVAAIDAGERRSGRPARTPSVHLGRPTVGDIANIHELLSVVDGGT